MVDSSTIRGALGASSGAPAVKLCIVCRQPIGTARLSVRPHAQRCIDCQTAVDIPLIRMLVETRGDNEIVETLFTSADRGVVRYLDYTNHHTAGTDAFDQVRGDDSHLVPVRNEVIDSTSGLTAAVFIKDTHHLSDEGRASLVARNTGKVMSEESHRKMSQARMGVPQGARLPVAAQVAN